MQHLRRKEKGVLEMGKETWSKNGTRWSTAQGGASRCASLVREHSECTLVVSARSRKESHKAYISNACAHEHQDSHMAITTFHLPQRGV